MDAGSSDRHHSMALAVRRMLLPSLGCLDPGMHGPVNLALMPRLGSHLFFLQFVTLTAMGQICSGDHAYT